jgi:hypothetical protein
MLLEWHIEEFAETHDGVFLGGWCHHADSPIRQVMAVFADPTVVVPLESFGLPSPDVAAVIGPTASSCRFGQELHVPTAMAGRDFHLRFFLADGTTRVARWSVTKTTERDPFHRCWAHFLQLLESIPGGKVLEIGSRARSAVTRRAAIPRHLAYVGIDILPGPNVGILGDVHELRTIISGDKFVAAFSFSVFEHLAMPWKVALELNHVLTSGAIVFTQSHQTWPQHEEPWDFWRFSQYSWQTLFNAATGFEVVEAAVGEPGRISAFVTNGSTRELAKRPAYLGSACIVRKTAETKLEWPVTTAVAAAGCYPPGELAEPPR